MDLILAKKHTRAQGRLLSASSDLAANSEKLQGAMDVLLDYEQRSSNTLKQLLGGSLTRDDIAFYGIGALLAVGSGAFTVTRGARLPLIVVLGASMTMERLVFQKYSSLLDINDSGRVS